MSDFTDDEDRQLVQLARMFTRNDKQIPWKSLTQTMKGTKKRKDVLRQRLKTLKRTHGPDLEKFPAWFFKKEFPTKIDHHHMQASRQMSANVKTTDKQRQTALQTKTNLQSTNIPTKLENSPTLNMSPRFQKCEPPMKIEPLVLLASVACTTSHRFDSRCA